LTAKQQAISRPLITWRETCIRDPSEAILNCKFDHSVMLPMAHEKRRSAWLSDSGLPWSQDLVLCAKFLAEMEAHRMSSRAWQFKLRIAFGHG
jgi:hypothetical protein